MHHTERLLGIPFVHRPLLQLRLPIADRRSITLGGTGQSEPKAGI